MNRLTPETATDDGFTTIILAIGGSATNNLGAAMVQALEFKLQDKMVSLKAVHKVIFTRMLKIISLNSIFFILRNHIFVKVGFVTYFYRNTNF